MKLSLRPVIACAGVFTLVSLVAVVAAHPVRSAPPRTMRVTGGCPRQAKPAIQFGPAQWVAINRAIRAEVPRVFADLTSMGHKAWPGFQIRAVIAPLGGAPLGADAVPPKSEASSATWRWPRATAVGGRPMVSASDLPFPRSVRCRAPTDGLIWASAYAEGLASLELVTQV